jgi:F0F1-type ATP synthase delta subunit
MITSRAMAKALISLVEDDGLDARVVAEQFVDFARKNNIGNQLQHVLKGLKEEYQGRNDRNKVIIETAQPTSEATALSLVRFVAAPAKNPVERKVNSEIIGGFRVRSQGKLFDASFQNSLVRLKKLLEESI